MTRPARCRSSRRGVRLARRGCLVPRSLAGAPRGGGRGELPARAAAVVEERGYRGPLFNEYGWGSYLIWRLQGLPVSIDGRADLHGPERIRRNVETISGLQGWDSDPDLMAANTVIINAKAALASLLRLDSRFELVHEDPVAAVFIARRVDAGRNER